MSFYDKEEERYLFESRITEKRQDRVDINIPLQFDIEISNGVSTIENISPAKELSTPYIEINDFTLVDHKRVKEYSDGINNVIRCSQCDAIIGREASYYTYENEPLCHQCMKDDIYGFVCPNCGLKYPNNLKNNGFCEQCAEEYDI